MIWLDVVLLHLPGIMLMDANEKSPDERVV